MELSDEDRRRVDQDIAAVGPDDERKVREQFAEKYGAIGQALLTSRFRVVRDLALNVACLYEMLVDPDYALEWKTKAAVIFALGYFISPADAIPDTLPVLGYVDDALVVAYVCHLLADQIADYRRFRREQGRPLPTPE